MSETLYREKLEPLAGSYIAAIDSALARRDFATAQKLGVEWDKRVARLTSIRQSRSARGPLRRKARRATSARQV